MKFMPVLPGTGAQRVGNVIGGMVTARDVEVGQFGVAANAAALALVRMQQGHAFLDFETPVLLPSIVPAEEFDVPPVRSFDEHRGWLPLLRESGVYSQPPQPGELMVLEGSRLYLRRLWEEETWLAAWLHSRSGMSDGGGATAATNAAAVGRQPWLHPLLDAVFPVDSPAEQSDAVRRCIDQPLGVIVGGPGTGKTFVVARLLVAQSVAFALREGRRPRVLVLAPTGKAARRVESSVRAAVDALRTPMDRLLHAWRTASPVARGAQALELAMEGLSQLVGRASTIHSALGVDPRGAGLFKFGQHRPWRADIVVVDEASMVSLSLMRALCAAVAQDAQLFLLGDHCQLQSVEAGSVLSDISGEEVDASSAPSASSAPLASCVHRLRVSRRFPQDSGLGKLAAAVRSGAVDGAGALQSLHLLEHDASVRGLVALRSPGSGRTTAEAVEVAAAKFASLRDPTRTPEQRLELLESFAMLCGHRRGPGGSEEINAAMVKRWSPRGAHDGVLYDGMPVLVLENDADLGLSNGDLGVVCAQANGALYACFDGGRRVRAEMLPAHAPAYALTVHKSQGSEYGSLALVLPERESPVLTRELIYTALTRWKASGNGGVTIIARRDVLEAALRARVQRASGLGERLVRART